MNHHTTASSAAVDSMVQCPNNKELEKHKNIFCKTSEILKRKRLIRKRVKTHKYDAKKRNGMSQVEWKKIPMKLVGM